MEIRWLPALVGAGIGFGYGLYSMWRKERRAPVIGVHEDDPRMVQAIAQARESLPAFIGALDAPRPGDRDFSVKALLPDLQEHVWVTDVRYRDGVFSGRLGNMPVGDTTLRFGDPIRVQSDAVTDWKYIQHGVLIGGYTIRLLRRLMSEQERSDFDRQIDFRILD